MLRNDEITTEAWLKDLVEHETKFAGRAIQQIYHVDFFNQHGDLVAEADSWCFRTDRDNAREEGTKYTELRQKPVRRYTDEELADACKLYAEEKIRGAETRYWEDVKVGEELPTMVKGPMTVTGFIAYAQGWGGLYIRANKLAWKLQDAHPGLGIKNRFSIPDCPERVHWEEEFAHEVGAPGAYDYGPERCSWLTHHMTNWMGDDGFLRNANCKIRRHNPDGDMLFIKGKVDAQVCRGRPPPGRDRAGGAQPGRRAVGPGHRHRRAAQARASKPIKSKGEKPVKRVVLALFALLLALPAAAQTYPNRPVRWILLYQAGQGTDWRRAIQREGSARRWASRSSSTTNRAPAATSAPRRSRMRHPTATRC